MKYGIQLFGARELFRKDPQDFFKTVSDMGFGMIEPCLVAETMPPRMSETLWKVEEVPTFVKMMDALGLEMISCHAFGLEDRMVELREKFGFKYFVAHCGKAASEFDKRLDELGRLSEDLHAAGAELWLHNGAGDCTPGRMDGVSVLEALLNKLPYAKSQFDNGWAILDGADQYALMETLGDKLGCLHIKEVGHGWQDKPMAERFAAPGEGISDIKRLLTINGTRPVILDEDFPVRDWYDDFERTMKAFKAAE